MTEHKLVLHKTYTGPGCAVCGKSHICWKCGVTDCDVHEEDPVWKIVEAIQDGRIPVVKQAIRAEVKRQTNEELIARITNYLTVGGLFNPELMEHDKVRDLLMECREALGA